MKITARRCHLHPIPDALLVPSSAVVNPVISSLVLSSLSLRPKRSYTQIDGSTLEQDSVSYEPFLDLGLSQMSSGGDGMLGRAKYQALALCVNEPTLHCATRV